MEVSVKRPNSCLKDIVVMEMQDVIPSAEAHSPISMSTIFHSHLIVPNSRLNSPLLSWPLKKKKTRMSSLSVKMDETSEFLYPWNLGANKYMINSLEKRQICLLKKLLTDLKLHPADQWGRLLSFSKDALNNVHMCLNKVTVSYSVEGDPIYRDCESQRITNICHFPSNFRTV